MKIEKLEHIFKSPYDSENWKDVLRNLFSGKEVIYSTSRQDIQESSKHQIANSILEIGSLTLSDKKIIRFYDVELIQGKHVSKNRVELRNLLHNRIVPGDTDAILVCFHTVGDKDWRLTFISKSIYWDDDYIRQKEETHPKRYTYVLGEDESIRTALNQFEGLFHSKINIKQITDAFSVEKLNKEFFSNYKKHYERFWRFVADPTNDFRTLFYGITPEKQDKAIRDFTKKLLGRIVFLYFLQKKGWMGCSPNSDTWADGKRQFMKQLFEGFANPNRFHSDCLTKLFFKTLNERREGDLFSVEGLSNALNNTRVPYLNGGLFESDKPIGVQDINFPSSFFKELLEFLSQYNFTIDENSPDDHEVGIDPEMLGHIFENLLEENKERGAFYTPKEIVQYMTQESLIQYLQNHLGEHPEIEAFIRYGNKGNENDKNNFIRNNGSRIEHLLDKVKICDPAIGSGAFPMGMLHEIFRAKMSLDWTLNRAHRAKVKRDIIQNSIYGVDLENGAVDIARLRFWLALVVDEDIPEPLPNLDYKIMQGNSLLESFEGIDLSEIHEGKSYTVAIKNAQLDAFSGQEKKKVSKNLDFERIEDLIKKYFHADDPKTKKDLHMRIDTHVLDHIHFTLEEHKTKLKKQAKKLKSSIEAKVTRLSSVHQKIKYQNESKEAKKLTNYRNDLGQITDKEIKLGKLHYSSDRPFFLWHLFFKEVFDEGGFDIVIGNPPYVQLQKMKEQANVLANEGYETFTRTGDIYALFYELGIKNLKENIGILSYITSNKWMRAKYGQSLRTFFLNKGSVLRLIDFGDARFFENATTYTNILIFSNGLNNSEETQVWDLSRKFDFKSSMLSNLYENNNFSFEFNETSFLLLNNHEHLIKKKIEEMGIPLHSWDIRINYGIKTGFNEAFLIDSNTRSKLLNIDTKNQEIIKPILRGKDIKRYKVESDNLFLIHSHNGTNNIDRIDLENQYPSIFDYLKSFKSALKKRYDQGAHWSNLRNCAYFPDFEKKKIIWAEIVYDSAFFYDREAIFVEATSFFLVGNYLQYLTALLNSKLLTYAFKKYYSGGDLRGNTFRYKKAFLQRLPVIPPNEKYVNLFERLVDQIQFLKRDDITFTSIDQHASGTHMAQLIEEVIDGCVFELYFEEHMKERGINILDLVQDLIIDIEDKDDDEKVSLILKTFHNIRNSEVNTRIKLFSVKSPEILKPVIQS